MFKILLSIVLLGIATVLNAQNATTLLQFNSTNHNRIIQNSIDGGAILMEELNPISNIYSLKKYDVLANSFSNLITGISSTDFNLNKSHNFFNNTLNKGLLTFSKTLGNLQWAQLNYFYNNGTIDTITSGILTNYVISEPTKVIGDTLFFSSHGKSILRSNYTNSSSNSIYSTLLQNINIYEIAKHNDDIYFEEKNGLYSTIKKLTGTVVTLFDSATTTSTRFDFFKNPSNNSLLIIKSFKDTSVIHEIYSNNAVQTTTSKFLYNDFLITPAPKGIINNKLIYSTPSIETVDLTTHALSKLVGLDTLVQSHEVICDPNGSIAYLLSFNSTEKFCYTIDGINYIKIPVQNISNWIFNDSRGRFCSGNYWWNDFSDDNFQIRLGKIFVLTKDSAFQFKSPFGVKFNGPPAVLNNEVYLMTDSAGVTEKLIKTSCEGIVTSTNDFNLNYSIMLYPNPTTQTLTIQSSQNTTPENIIITDILGKEVLHLKDTKIINVQTLSNGIYFLNIRLEHKIYQGKFIKQ